MSRQIVPQPRPPVTVFLRPSFSITTRDGELNVAVRAQSAPKPHLAQMPVAQA